MFNIQYVQTESARLRKETCTTNVFGTFETITGLPSSLHSLRSLFPGNEGWCKLVQSPTNEIKTRFNKCLFSKKKKTKKNSKISRIENRRWCKINRVEICCVEDIKTFYKKGGLRTRTAAKLLLIRFFVSVNQK